MSDCDTLTTKKRRRRVWKGDKDCKGLPKDELTKNKRGEIVSKQKHSQTKERYEKLDLDGPKGWMLACKQASDILGFWPVPIRKGTEFYKLSKKLFEESKSSYTEFEVLPSAYSPYIPPQSFGKSPRKNSYKDRVNLASPIKRVEITSPAPKASISKSGPQKRMKKNSVVSIDGYSPFKP